MVQQRVGRDAGTGAARSAGQRALGTAGAAGVRAGSDRGDVPGWVLVTVMTAGLVVGLAAVAGPALQDVFTTAISSVTVR